MGPLNLIINKEMIKEVKELPSTSDSKKFEYGLVLRRITEIESTGTNVRHIPNGEGKPGTISEKAVDMARDCNNVVLYGGARSLRLAEVRSALEEAYMDISVTFDYSGTAD